jgi:transposase-like protein
LYFTTEASYRAVAKTLHVSKNIIFHELNQLGENCKSFLKVAQELKPKWSGYLLIDGKMIRIKKEKEALLITADAKTQDIPCAGLFDAEDTNNYKSLLENVKNEIKYPIKGIIVDGDPALSSAISSVFPNIPIQLCVRHYSENLKNHFKYHYRGIPDGIPRFLELAQWMLYVKNIADLDCLYKEYLDKLDYFRITGLKKEVDQFENNFGKLWTHLYHPRMPRTTNIIEGIIRQLSRKIDDTDGFNSHRTAWNSLKLMIMNYRFKRFSCSRIKGHNGKGPLELAGVNISKINWVTFSKNESDS